MDRGKELAGAGGGFAGLQGRLNPHVDLGPNSRDDGACPYNREGEDLSGELQ